MNSTFQSVYSKLIKLKIIGTSVQNWLISSNKELDELYSDLTRKDPYSFILQPGLSQQIILELIQILTTHHSINNKNPPINEIYKLIIVGKLLDTTSSPISSPQPKPQSSKFPAPDTAEKANQNLFDEQITITSTTPFLTVPKNIQPYIKQELPTFGQKTKLNLILIKPLSSTILQEILNFRDLHCKTSIIGRYQLRQCEPVDAFFQHKITEHFNQNFNHQQLIITTVPVEDDKYRNFLFIKSSTLYEEYKRKKFIFDINDKLIYFNSIAKAKQCPKCNRIWETDHRCQKARSFTGM